VIVSLPEQMVEHVLMSVENDHNDDNHIDDDDGVADDCDDDNSRDITLDDMDKSTDHHVIDTPNKHIVSSFYPL